MVIQAIKLDGLKKSEASQLFNISRNTIDLWLKRFSETGDYQVKPNQPPGNGHKITDWEEFREFASSHGDKTQVEMAKLWKEQISDSEATLKESAQIALFHGRSRKLASLEKKDLWLWRTR